MNARNMLRFHVGASIAIIAALLLIASRLTHAPFFVGMMARCLSMMLMNGGRGRDDVSADPLTVDDRESM